MPNWPRRVSIRTPFLLLGLSEFLGAYFSVLVAWSILASHSSQNGIVIEFFSLRAAVFSCFVIVCLISMGLYHFHQRLYFREILARASVGMLFSALPQAAIYLFFPTVSLPKEVWALAIALSLVIILLVRRFFLHNADATVFRRRILVFGAGERVTDISKLRRRADRRGFIVVGTVLAKGDAGTLQTDGLIAHDQPLKDIASDLEIDEIVIAMHDRRGNLPVRELLECRNIGINVIELIDFLERESGRIPVDLINPSWLIFSKGFRTSPLRAFGKRIFDFAVSFVALLLVWPIMLLAAVAIKLEDGVRAPVFYRQIRVGHRGSNFSIMKFRSMVVDAESESGAVWAQKSDTRITRVGQFLRSSRIDELPQIYNVLLGQMSIVGPRPERPEFVQDLEKNIPYYSERHTVKPGVTGWAQLNYSYGASEEDAIEKLKYDLYYIENHSVLLDFLIILQTVEVVLWSKGAR